MANVVVLISTSNKIFRYHYLKEWYYLKNTKFGWRIQLIDVNQFLRAVDGPIESPFRFRTENVSSTG